MPDLDLEKAMRAREFAETERARDRYETLQEIGAQLARLVAVNELQVRLLRYTVLALAGLAGLQGWAGFH